MHNNAPSTNFTHMLHMLAGVSIIPALFLPFYQVFLHGGRLAMDINPRVAAYMGVHMLGNMLLGSIILLKRFLPWPIGILFLVGGLFLGIALMVPPWIEVIGYATEGLAIAWSAFLIWRDCKPIVLVAPVA